MAADDASERTEQPTPRRRQEARSKGQVARSTDLTAAVVLLAGLLLLNWLGPGMFNRMLTLLQELSTASDPSGGEIPRWIAQAGYTTAMVLAPFMLTLLLVTAAGGMVQTRALFSWNLLSPKLENLSPTKGVKRLFSTDSVTRLLQGIFKMLLVVGVGWMSVRNHWLDLLGAGSVPTESLLPIGAELVFTLALRMALVLLILGLIDFFYQQWKLNQSLKMTKQEVRDEMKQMDGDPLMRQRRRQAQMKIAMQRLRIDVPKADVIVTNPTEYAVALKYEEGVMSAPRVVAKGVDLVAMRIRQIAQEFGVPIVQRPPLARALYAAVEVGQEVPAAYYRAVAEVLAYVYQISRPRTQLVAN